MKATTPRLRAHLLAELRDLPDHTATTEELAWQVPFPHRAYGEHGSTERGAFGQYVYPHLCALEKKGLVRKVKYAGSNVVRWRLVTA